MLLDLLGTGEAGHSVRDSTLEGLQIDNLFIACRLALSSCVVLMQGVHACARDNRAES